MADKYRPVRYESLPYGNPGTTSFPETEQRLEPSAFHRRPGNIQLSAIRTVK